MSDASEEVPLQRPALVKALRSESFNVPRLVSFEARPNRSGSSFVPPLISEQLIEKVQKEKKGKVDHAVHLKQRGLLRHMLQAGEVD